MDVEMDNEMLIIRLNKYMHRCGQMYVKHVLPHACCKCSYIREAEIEMEGKQKPDDEVAQNKDKEMKKRSKWVILEYLSLWSVIAEIIWLTIMC